MHEQGNTRDPGKGYFKVPNRLLAEGCRRPVALAVYARLVSTPGIWQERGDLERFEVRASRADLMAATGATADKVRGALGWLIRRGFLERRDTSRTGAAVFRILQPIPKQTPKREANANPTGPMTSGGAVYSKSPSESPSFSENPQANPQANPQEIAQPNAMRDNDLPGSPKQRTPKRIPKQIPKVLKTLEDVEDNYTPPPPATPEGVVRLWYEAHGGNPPPEPKATSNPDGYRATALERATAGESPEDIAKMFRSWVAATDPDWRGRGGGGVTDFAKAAPFWIKCRDVERMHQQRSAGDEARPVIDAPERLAVTESPGGRESQPAPRRRRRLAPKATAGPRSRGATRTPARSRGARLAAAVAAYTPSSRLEIRRPEPPGALASALAYAPDHLTLHVTAPTSQGFPDVALRVDATLFHTLSLVRNGLPRHLINHGELNRLDAFVDRLSHMRPMKLSEFIIHNTEHVSSSAVRLSPDFGAYQAVRRL